MGANKFGWIIIQLSEKMGLNFFETNWSPSLPHRIYLVPIRFKAFQVFLFFYTASYVWLSGSLERGRAESRKRKMPNQLCRRRRNIPCQDSLHTSAVNIRKCQTNRVIPCQAFPVQVTNVSCWHFVKCWQVPNNCQLSCQWGKYTREPHFKELQKCWPIGVTGSKGHCKCKFPSFSLFFGIFF